jgi:hypothetical protein
MGVLDDAIREHLDLKRRRGASDDELARAEAEALGPARRAPYEDDEGDDGLGAAETVVIAPMRDPAPPPPAAGPTRAVHDIDEDPMPPPAPVDRVERPDLDRAATLDQDTAEHPAPVDQLPLDEDDEDDDASPPAGEPPSAQDDGPGRVSE